MEARVDVPNNNVQPQHQDNVVVRSNTNSQVEHEQVSETSPSSISNSQPPNTTSYGLQPVLYHSEQQAQEEQQNISNLNFETATNANHVSETEIVYHDVAEDGIMNRNEQEVLKCSKTRKCCILSLVLAAVLAVIIIILIVWATAEDYSCGRPDPIGNGGIRHVDSNNGDSFTLGHHVSYTCHLGYTLTGPRERTCMVNKLWSDFEPYCSAVTCNDPGTPLNGVRTVGGFSYKETVYYECKPGFRLSGSSNITCMHTGYWTDNRPHCVDYRRTEVRLVGGSTKSGRVRVLHNGIWRGVCDDRWDDGDARVVCRMLGWNYGEAHQGDYPRFGTPMNDNFWLDEVDCKGSERNIDQCSHAGWGNHDCTRNEAAKVTCT